jgi:peptidoglycan-associated lipoprotein
MRNKILFGLILLALLPGFLATVSCSKENVKSDTPAVMVQEEELAAEKTEQEKAAALEQQRRAKEAAEREFRAARIKFMYEDIYFKSGSYQLSPGARENLKGKAEWLRNHPEISVIIEGHTNQRGAKEYNFALGDRRAGAVKSFLIREGIKRERLNAVSYGNEQPVDKGKTQEARAKNRRVHFVIEE